MHLIDHSDTYETYTHDGMAAKIMHFRCYFDARVGIYVDEEFAVELYVSPCITIMKKFDTLYGARSWILEQFDVPRSLLILKYQENYV